METDPPPLVAEVLRWAQEELRALPWRGSRDPWEILVAETMLQQTQVARVVERWPRFLACFPTATSCADSSAAALQREWAGLGYNRRALMLHRAAIEIRDLHHGRVPDSLDELLALPGVGPYTARAVLAFAFERSAAPIDTNIGRVLARVLGTTLTPAEAQARADALIPEGDSWLWNQGIMELGALVCTKTAPDCAGCVIRTECRWRGEGADPAQGSAGTSRPQSRFAGSDRELRGRLVDALREAPMPAVQVGSAIGCADAERTQRVITGLVADGMVERVGPRVQLAGERELSPGR